jgi:hypothetical protein
MTTRRKLHAKTAANSLFFNPSSTHLSSSSVYTSRLGLFLFFTYMLPVWAFTQPADSTTVKTVFGSTNTELQELMSVLGVEKHHLELQDAHLRGKHVQLTYQEYRNGVAQPPVNLTSRRELFQLDSSGKLALEVYARAADATTLETFFRFPRVGQRNFFKVEAGQAGHYSFRTDILAYQRGEAKIPVGKKFTFLVYTLPYEKDGYYQYCTLAQSQIPIEDWYTQFGIKHFVAYQLLIE